MSYLRLNVRDRDRVISGEVHGVTGDRLIAALSAEPETVGELEKALERFVQRESADWSPFDRFANHENLEPYDAGILVLDLAGRTIGVESSYSAVALSGDIAVRSEFVDEAVNIPYRVPGDWLIAPSIHEYEGVALRRREQRSKTFPFDARRILYGPPLLEFIMQECAAADPAAEGINAEIHVKWLMTPRDDLQGLTPRELLLEKRDFISWDLHSRSLQWSFTKVEPPPLSPDSQAYLFGGFGTCEVVVYYDLVRLLTDISLDRRQAGKALPPAQEVEFLSRLKNEWLAARSPEFSGRTPHSITEAERRRINMTMSAPEYLSDEDCPCCSSLAEEFDMPMFWSLDGSGMDDRFEFSFHKTLAEWDAEQLSYEKFNREFAEGKWQDDDLFEFDNDGPLDDEIIK